MRVRRILVVVLVLAGLAGCNRAAAPKEIAQDSHRTKARVVVKVAGAEKIEFAGTVTILIYRTLDKRVPANLRLFSVGIPPPHVSYAPGISFRAAFDVLGYTDRREFTIPKTVIGSPVPGPSGLPLPSGIQSNAFLEVFRPAAQPPVTRYDIALEPCTVTTSGGRALEGSLRCPTLRRDSGPATISLEMTWDAGGT